VSFAFARPAQLLRMLRRSLPLLLWLLLLCVPGLVIQLNSFPERRLQASSPLLLLLGILAITLHLEQLLRNRSALQQPLEWRSLALLGCCLAGWGLAPWLPQAPAFCWILGGAALFASSTLSWMREWQSGTQRFREPLILWLLFSLLFFFSGIRHAHSVGEHSGDEAHYLTQALSLWEDGDLDLHNNLPGDPPESKRGHYHISPNARDGHWYSWHSAGLSYLLAPTLPLPMPFRYLLLAMLAALGPAALYRALRLESASIRCAAFASAGVGLSLYSVVYASRALPESSGASLVMLGFLAVLQQAKAPLRSAMLCALCVGLLPWLQSRFLPPALTLMGSYGLEGLLRLPNWKRRFQLLLPFSLACFILLSLYKLHSYGMFVGGQAYPVEDLLFSDLKGLWHTLGSFRGVITSFPFFLAALLSLFPQFRSRETRMQALYALLLFLSVWLSSCATEWFTGGSTVPGRFLLVISLPICSLGIRSWKLQCAGGRLFLHGWLLWISPLLLLLHMILLPLLGTGFYLPFVQLAQHPAMAPVPELFYDPYQTWQAGAAAALCLILILLERKALSRPLPTTLCISSCLLVFILGSHAITIPDEQRVYRSGIRLEIAPLQGYLWRAAGKRNPVVDLFSGSNRNPWQGMRGPKNVSSEDRGRLDDGRWISLPYVPENDWAGRGYRWATLTAPYRPPEAKHLFALQGELRGDSPVELVLREGQELLGRWQLDANTQVDLRGSFETRNRGDLYVLVRFLEAEAPTELECSGLWITVYTPAMLQRGRIRLQP